MIIEGNSIEFLQIQAGIYQALQSGKDGTGEAKIYGDLEAYKKLGTLRNRSFTKMEKSVGR
jgi:hypothetical protein